MTCSDHSSGRGKNRLHGLYRLMYYVSEKHTIGLKIHSPTMSMAVTVDLLVPSVMKDLSPASSGVMVPSHT